MRRKLYFAAVAATLLIAASGFAQQAPAGGQRRGGGRTPPAPDDNTGFEAIFDGKTLNNWDGDPAFWKVADGAIVGQSTPENPVKVNTFVIWRGGSPRDFEFKLEYRINSTNSGVQYRSVVLSDVGKWVMKGYQADIDAANTYTGQIYEERGRGFLAMRGQAARIAEGGKVKIMGSLGESDALKAFIKPDDWNQLHIIAHGNTIIQILNGHVTALLVDEDTQGRAMEGLIGMQMHVGQPMKVEFRNIMLKKL